VEINNEMKEVIREKDDNRKKEEQTMREAEREWIKGE
jgi:hypothetical protein